MRKWRRKMQIIFDERQKIFHLYNKKISYVIQIEKERYLKHCYYGKRIKKWNGGIQSFYYDRGFCANPIAEDRTFSLDTQQREFPEVGQGDFRSPAYELVDEQGDKNARFFYHSFRILKGKVAPEGLPHVYTEQDEEAMTLEITLQDKVRNQRILLYYTIYEETVVTRFAKWINDGNESVEITRFLSMNMDLPTQEYDVLTFAGAHVEEKNVYRRPLCADSIVIESRRGTSSPQATPFLGILSPQTTEEQGEVLGVNLIYSGDFYGCVQCGQYGTTRVQIGLNPFQFRWKLSSQESFCTPEAVLVYSEHGLSGMTKVFHELYRKRVCRGMYREKERPVLLNSWEGMYFDINEDKILNLAEEAVDLGIELLVMDDGWFKGRNTDTTSLGDWVEDTTKFPNGLQNLAKKVQQKGIGFGIWFEPEMISEESDLYRVHPDWVIRSPLYDPIRSRNQLVLDLSNPAVCEYLIQAVSQILEPGNISYVKWDMNRHLTDLGSAYLGREKQMELSHRYVIGLYYVLEKLTQRFPNVLFEGCSSGGGRFDAGMLYYMPQTWTSDNTDAICRLKIQYGTSFLFPTVTMGSHVSACPNHQVGRTTPLATRFAVAAAGNLGYELDLKTLSKEEKEQVRVQIMEYKKRRRTIQFGNYYRLSDPFQEKWSAWNIVSEDGKEVIFTHVQILARAAYRIPVIQLRGLDPEAIYIDCATGQEYGGDELMYVGIRIPRIRQDFSSTTYVFRKA